jgi:alkane 1-monooxygenase
MAAVPYALGFLLPPLVVWTTHLGGAWTFLPVAFVFFALPLIDTLAGLNERDADPAVEQSIGFRLVTWLWVPTQLGVLVWALRTVASGALSGVETVGLMLGVAVCTGTIGITYAHELIHRAAPWERALGELLLTSVSYPHFAIEHVFGHHRRVATRQDPATARYGESFARFLPRTLAGSLVSAWRIETERQARRRRAWWHPANRMWRYGAGQAAMYAGAWGLFGPAAAGFLAAQAFVAVSQLEVINYIEHYGLERREVAPGTPEPIAPWHSWDSHYRISNWLLINLARHADHHGTASRRYPALRANHAAPQLPAGYGVMFILALVPPLWRRVMDPRVEQWRAEHLR